MHLIAKHVNNLLCGIQGPPLAATGWTGKLELPCSAQMPVTKNLSPLVTFFCCFTHVFCCPNGHGQVNVPISAAGCTNLLERQHCWH